jgi:hypothetical protein
LFNPKIEIEPNSTLDRAQDLGDLSVSGRSEVIGSIGDGSGPSAAVDWYSFRLDRVTHVTLTTPPGSGANLATPVLSLYNSDPNDVGDPYDVLNHRLLAQDDGGTHGGNARIERGLAAGTYYVAVSDSGNAYFHPFLADSGSPGSSGEYGLAITGDENGFDAADGPALLASDPAPSAVLDHSPLIIRVDFSAALAPATILPGQTVQLLSNTTGTFGQGNDQPVALAGPPNFSSAADELQLIPTSALLPGFYELVLSGDSSSGQPVLTDVSGTPLGKNADHASGQDLIISFQVNGIEGNSGGTAGDDTLATAHTLGDLPSGQPVQLPGALGADPAYSNTSSDPRLNPGNDVNLYHFKVSGPGRYAFSAEVFAGRIGSPLSPALSLFQADPDSAGLKLLTLNAGTLNDTPATDGSLPLYTDAAVYAGMTEGDYYLAVSGNGNLPDPALGAIPGSNGRIFDTSNSGQAGTTTGAYVLNLLLLSTNDTPPQVVAVTPAAGELLTAPPTQLTVQFNDIIDLQQMAFQAGQNNSMGQLPAVYVLGSDGTKYFPRLTAYDTNTRSATFMMLDALPNGVNELHLSGSQGLANLAGVPLAGNDPSGDYVVRFNVESQPRGTGSNPLLFSAQEPNHDPSRPQDLGVLFPHELESHGNQAGVSIIRTPTDSSSNVAADTADYFRFQVLQSRPYFFSLTGSGLPQGTLPTLTDASSTPIPLIPQGDGSAGLVSLDAGTYIMSVSGWTVDQSATVHYQLGISLGASNENPTPLTIGPTPAYRLALAPYTPPSSVTPAPAIPTPASEPSSPPPAVTTDTLPPPAPVEVSSSSPSSPAPVVVSSASAPPGLVTTLLLPIPVVSVPPPSATDAARPLGSGAPSAATAPSPLVPPPVATPPSTVPVIATLPSPPSPTVAPPRLGPSLPPSPTSNAPVVPVGNPPTISPTLPAPVIPADVLLALRAMPVGGVRGPGGDVPPPVERVVLHGPDPALLEGQLRTVILTQPTTYRPPTQQESGTVGVEGPSPTANTPRPPAEQGQDASHLSRAELANIVKQSVRMLEAVWQQALENLFRERSGPRPPEKMIEPPAAPSEPNLQTEDSLQNDMASSAGPEALWTNALLGVASTAFVIPPSRTDRKRSPSPFSPTNEST